jgi:hypothetical protein
VGTDQVSPVNAGENFFNKKGMSGASDEQLLPKDDLEARQKKLWGWADKQVVPWGKLQTEDYDFRWAKDASNELLRAGCLYEYARESQQFRCLLVVTDLRRKQQRFGTVPVIEFEGDSAGFVYLYRSGWHRWLKDFTSQLVANKSFAELLRTSRIKVEKSLEALPGYSILPKAVELPGRHIGIPGLQDLLIQIDWRRYTDKEIGEEMAKFAKAYRPPDEKEPRRLGQRLTTERSYIKALSVMRIWKHERNQWKRLNLVKKACGYKGCVRELKEYKKRCDQGHGAQPMSNNAKAEMSRARADARSFFQRLFAGEKPSNY